MEKITQAVQTISRKQAVMKNLKFQNLKALINVKLRKSISNRNENII